LDECEKIVEKALMEKRRSLLIDEGQRICSLHDIPTPLSVVVLDVETAVQRAHEIGYPVALKILSKQILHKTNVGGVTLDLRTESELRQAYEKMLVEVRNKEPLATISGFLIQRMMPPSTETIIGGIRDPQFGPVVMFGMGGIFTELYDDVSFRVAPIDRVDAQNMIHDLKGVKVFEGFRGAAPVDENILVNVLINVSTIMVDHDRIKQLDLNPVIAYSDHVCAVDSRVIL